jgi:hypothetical protein
MSTLLRQLTALSWLACIPALASETKSCDVADDKRATLTRLKERAFVIEGGEARLKIARSLLPCLAAADPELRDQIAYTALRTWLRAGVIEPKEVVRWGEQLLGWLEPTQGDPVGVAKPFAALVLAEIARSDRVQAHFEPSMRTRMLERAIAYFLGISDYRGFDQEVGYRHGLAHAADWLMQLALNPAYVRSELVLIRDALPQQIRTRTQALVDGEPERLARTTLMLMQRSELRSDDWHAFFERVSEPAPLQHWAEAYQSRAGLNQRHNVRSFLLELELAIKLNGLANADDLLAEIKAALLRIE